MIFVVTTPLMEVKTLTDAELASIVTQYEHDKITKLAVGEVLELRRSFGTHIMKIVRTTRS